MTNVNSGVVSTLVVPAQQQFHYFREEIVQRFGLGDVRLNQASERGFVASVAAVPIADVMLVEIASDAVAIERTKKDIERWDRQWYTVGVVLDGHCTLAQHGRETTLGSYDMVLCDSASPFRMRFDRAFRQLIILFDRETLLRRLPAAERFTARRFDGSEGLGSVTTSMLRTLSQEARKIGCGQDVLAKQALDLVTLSFGGSHAVDETSVHETQRARVQAFIETNLFDPKLGPDMIAHHHGFSRRYLYRLFEGTGEAVSEYIRRQRLERCRSALSDPAHAAKSISEVAFACGIGDLSHFSRDFRTAFGISPREFRDAVLLRKD